MRVRLCTYMCTQQLGDKEDTPGRASLERPRTREPTTMPLRPGHTWSLRLVLATTSSDDDNCQHTRVINGLCGERRCSHVAHRAQRMDHGIKRAPIYCLLSRRRISTAPRARAVLARDVRVTTIRAHQKEEAEDLACQTHADAAAAEPVLPLESRPHRRPQHATPARAHDAHVGRGAGASGQPCDHPGVQRPADAVSVGPAAVERQRPERRPAAEDLRPIGARANCLRSRGGRRRERPPRGRPYTRGGDCGSSPHGADRRSARPQRRGSCG